MMIETNSKKIISKLVGDGWQEVQGGKGSHRKLKKDNATIIVPHPKKDLPIGTARSIAKAAGWL